MAKNLIAELEGYQPYDADETGHLKKILAFLKRVEKPFSRETLEGHITASAWVIDQSGTSTLLCHHKKLGKWLQPGGHCDDSPDVLDAALREVEEETGITKLEFEPNVFDVDAHIIPARSDEPEHIHYDVRYLLIANMNDPITVSDESHDVQWKAIKDIAEHSDLKRMAEKTKAKLAP